MYVKVAIFLEFALVELYSIQHTLKLVPDMFTEAGYAVDTVSISAVFEKLEISSSELEASCKNWGIKVNPDKCKIVSADAGHM